MSGVLVTDPALQLTVRSALALLFFWAAAHKLRDRATFRTALGRYELLPVGWLRPFMALLIASELGVAVALLFPGSASQAALAAAGLFALYAGAIGINLRRGRRDIDCGCAGVQRGQALSAGLVVRNIVLLGAALACAPPVTPRALTWLDGVTVAAGTVTLLLLYAAADGLLAHASRARVRRTGDDRSAAGLLEPAHQVKHA